MSKPFADGKSTGDSRFSGARGCSHPDGTKRPAFPGKRVSSAEAEGSSAGRAVLPTGEEGSASFCPESLLQHPGKPEWEAAGYPLYNMFKVSITLRCSIARGSNFIKVKTVCITIPDPNVLTMVPIPTGPPSSHPVNSTVPQRRICTTPIGSLLNLCPNPTRRASLGPQP